MGWDEAVFGWFHGKARALLRARVPAVERAREATLEELRERLRLFACALSERPIEVREAEDAGGFIGATILLPSAMRYAPTREENERAYLLRVVWSAAALRHGLALPTRDPLERALATLLAAPATSDAVLESYPGAAEGLRAHQAFALAMELPLERHRGAARALAALRRAHLGAPPVRSGAEGAWLDRALDARSRDRASLEAALRELTPPLRALGVSRRDALDPPLFWGWIGSPAPAADAASGEAGDDARGLSSGTEIAFKPREHVRRVELEKDPLQDNPLVHSFEKIHTAEEHRGGSKQPDGTDELSKHEEALRELDVREVVRTTERAASLLRSDVMIEGAAGDLADDDEPKQGIPYDEWNEKARAYRAGWCRVRPAYVRERKSAAEARAWLAGVRSGAARHIDALRAELQRIELARRWRSRQLDGAEIDDDAVVERHAALASGHPGPDRLYRARLRSAPELAVLLLIDASLSTDGWIQERRVLDVELESALVLADALDGLGVELAIASFHSHTRRDCRFDVVKAMSEPWHGGKAERRLASIEPAGYTRIGPALRHASAILERGSARRRLLLLITDAKPNDYDRYEGSYGIADVRQAVREAERSGIHVHALAIDPRARFYLPRMFGPSRHSAVPTPGDLAHAMGRVCADMRV